MRVHEWEETDGSGPLRQYRLYFLDGAGHVTAPPYEFEADGDETAAKLAEAWREGRQIELWCGARRVPITDPKSL